MGSQRNWRYAVDADDWMRFMEKRVMHEERRPVIRNGSDLMGPGMTGPYASRTFDWNDVACLSDGFWYSVGNQVRNSPDDTAHWMGITEGTLDGDGLQTLSEYKHVSDTAAIREYNRRFWTVDGVTNFGTWKVSGGGGTGGGAPTGPAGGDLTGTYPNPAIRPGRVGNDELAVNAVTPDKIADLPAVPVTAGDPTSKTYVDDQIAAVPPNPTTLPPSGPAGGDLTGTYPNPGIGVGKVTSSHLLDGTITDTDVAAANKDGAAGTPSLRTLGTGAQQAAPGTDSRFTDSRAPTGPAGGSLAGTYPNPTIAPLAVGNAELAASAVSLAKLSNNSVNSAKIVDASIVDGDVAVANKDGLAATPSMRTLGPGAQQAMPGNEPVARAVSIALPALAAGTWVAVTHGLGRRPVHAAFFESDVEIVLDYRLVSTTAIDVWTDIAVAASTYTMVVIG